MREEETGMNLNASRRKDNIPILPSSTKVLVLAQVVVHKAPDQNDLGLNPIGSRIFSSTSL